MKRFHRGDLVQCWYDTGAFGFSVCYGVVIASGNTRFTVKWESGRINRLLHDTLSVELAKNTALAFESMNEKAPD